VATINEARFAMRHMGLTAQSKRRDRRPTLDEMNRIVEYLRRRNLWHKGAMPMEYVTLFAIFSTRRLGEIARLERDHVDARRGKILVYDMKDPKKKLGNNVWVDVSAEAIRVLQAVPTTGARFFPYTVSAMSDAFKEARVECGVEELTFHDLRHEGVSRLFEMGHSIPEVSAMSGHKSWANLRRYTHLEQCGDKYAGWQWLDVIAPLPQRPLQTKPQS
jgi:integrase